MVLKLGGQAIPSQIIGWAKHTLLPKICPIFQQFSNYWVGSCPLCHPITTPLILNLFSLIRKINQTNQLKGKEMKNHILIYLLLAFQMLQFCFFYQLISSNSPFIITNDLKNLSIVQLNSSIGSTFVPLTGPSVKTNGTFLNFPAFLGTAIKTKQQLHQNN